MSDYRYGKPRTKKIEDLTIDPKYFPPKQIGPDGKEIPWSEDPATMAYLLNYTHNAKEAERREKLEAKERQEELRKMEAYEKQQRERSKQEQEFNRNLPERQFNMLLSGKYPRYNYGNYSIFMKPVLFGSALVPTPIGQQQVTSTKSTSIEPASNYLRAK